MGNADVANTPLTTQTAMYLSPVDLLRLSRLSKQFRSIFASRSAVFVWRTALTLNDDDSDVDLSEVDLKCYRDINEIQVASLLYERFCMVSYSFSPFFWFSRYL